MAEQLTFDLPVRSALGREDFFVAPANAAAVDLIDRDWPGGRLVLIGPSGAGKTHLAQVWAGEHGATVIEGRGLAAQLGNLIGAAQAIVVENIDRIAGARDDEEALFHLLNAQMGHGGQVLMTCAEPVAQLALILPDLASRLSGAASAVLNPPGDDLLAVLYVKLFSDRQLDVPADLIPYLVNRSERSFASVRETVDRLDATSLAERKPITKRMAARVLDNRG